MADAPRIGVAVGTIGATPKWWLESAIRLEAAGFRAVWAWDQFVGRGDPTVPVVEQWTTLAAAAGATSRLGLGTFVANVMNRHPAVLARMASTLQELSGGRFALGLGLGGGPKEHAAYGIPVPDSATRARHLEEAVAVIRALWSGGPVSRESDLYPLKDAHALPVPNPVPKLLIGAESNGGVRLAARIGDGWAAEEPAFSQFKGAYLKALEAEGKHRDDAWIALGLGGGGKTGQNALDDSPWISDPAGEWQRWHEAGADEVILTARTPADIDALVSSR
jgi:alkanesulfonate monooxygenase SsuD/methylene tetrahydromethanopterin reductase-like flavin-dependent oxidoreductase (luciferase family)